jgi:AAA domain
LAAGVPECYNCAQFLGHLPGQRGARGPIQLRPGDLVLMDEASMVANPDLADVIAQATESDAEVILAGDTQQLQAVENGGDLLRIETVTPGGPIVRRALDADPQTKQRRWTGQPFLYAGYREAELGYAVTDHVAQSRTVHTGLAVIAGTEDRQHAYVALTRGSDTNMAYVFTVSPKLADPAPGRARPRSWPATTGSPPSPRSCERAEAVCEIVHKALPRKRRGRAISGACGHE